MMNDTPCPVCNHLREQKRLAFFKHEWQNFDRLQTELEQHQATCEVINSRWYLGLWRNAVVVPAPVAAAE